MLCAALSYAELRRSCEWAPADRRRRLRITRSPSEGSQPLEERSGRKVATSELGQSGNGGEGSLLHAEVDLDVGVGGGELCMTEPGSNGGDVDAGMEQMHGRGVADDMGRDLCRVPRIDASTRGELRRM